MLINPEGKSFQGRFYALLENNPDRNAILFYQDGQEPAWNSLEQFYTQARGYAISLREHGLRKGDACVIVLPSSELSLMLTTATLLLGALPLLIAPPALQSEGAFSSLYQIIQRIIKKTNPTIVILPETVKGTLAELQSKNKTSDFLLGESEIEPVLDGHLPVVIPDENDIAAMQLTSGTTGFPRVCVWKQRNVMAALDGMLTAMRLSKDDICFNWTPLYHDMGLVNNFFLCITSGVPLVMLSPNDFIKKPSTWLHGLTKTGATTTWSPNFGFAIAAQRVRDGELEGVDLHRVRAFWNAAERIHYDTLLAFHKRFKPFGVSKDAIKTNFGCAENVGGATFSDPMGRFLVEHVDRRSFIEKRVAKPINGGGGGEKGIAIVGVGKPHPGIRVEILSRKGNLLPDGHIGEIAMHTPSRMEGYLADKRATQRALYKDLLRTGDLGYMRNGELFWVGRVRERINLRGVKLDPSDFEPVLFHISGLRQGNFAAFGVDDPLQGTQKIVLVVEVRDGLAQDSETISGEIRNEVFEHLGINISEIVLVKTGTLTKTSSGKRRHRYFQKLYMEGRLSEFEWKPGQGDV